MKTASAALALLLCACPSGPADTGDPTDPCAWYRDADGDGWGDPAQFQERVCDTVLPGWSLVPGDCDDDLATVFPGANEVCDDLDNDCDGFTDDADPDLVDAPAWYPDGDGDGFGDDALGAGSCEGPDGWIAAGGDCDDRDPAEHPAALERCDGDDDDCDGLVDEDDAADALTWYTDADRDGFGDPETAATACVPPPEAVFHAGDCDDRDPAENPAALEVCDGDDDDCDGLVDEDDAADAVTWYADADADGFGDPAATALACTAPAGFGADATDCDDRDPAENPAALEVCDGDDDDCDGVVDEDDAADAPTWYADADADGFGDPAVTARACTAPGGYLADATDCDDTDPAEHPTAAEVCDGDDDDCDGVVDEDDAADAPSWYADADADGWGDPATASRACAQPSGLVAEPGDCDDADPAVHPGAQETCDGVDQDCDGTLDEDASDALTWYADADADGWGDPGSSVRACTQPSGCVADSSDCDDTRAAVHPGAAEVCGGLDDDCDGLVDDDDASLTGAPRWYLDDDLDGYGDASAWADACAEPSGYVADASDCDDDDDDVNPAASESCDGLDEDCDGSVDDGGGCPCPVQTWGGHGYLFCASSQTWYSAEGRYNAYGYELVSIGSAAEHAWLVSAASATSSSACWWIGYSDQSSEGRWVWDSGETTTYTGWASGQPDDGSYSEDCAEFVASGSGLWNDEQCWSSCYHIQEAP